MYKRIFVYVYMKTNACMYLFIREFSAAKALEEHHLELKTRSRQSNCEFKPSGGIY